mmetsp:Transcript_66508/g.214906  ORF Transcript_66508/g.214906 Transcript_66508/m.214906 type:complete len:100 (-) Transcript_66508:2-301(-)
MPCGPWPWRDAARRGSDPRKCHRALATLATPRPLVLRRARPSHQIPLSSTYSGRRLCVLKQVAHASGRLMHEWIASGWSCVFVLAPMLACDMCIRCRKA